MTDHARAAADVALDDRAPRRPIQRGEGVCGRDREAIRLAEPAVIGLGHHRQQPRHRDALAHGIGETASRTTPTECVLVMQIGVASRPCSSSQIVPVISPLPLNE